MSGKEEEKQEEEGKLLSMEEAVVEWRWMRDGTEVDEKREERNERV